jgi:lysophospholipase L1-like esterase
MRADRSLPVSDFKTTFRPENCRLVAGLVAIAVAGVVSGPACAGDQPIWVGTWGASPQQTTIFPGTGPTAPGFSNQTIRQIMRISVGGRWLRVRLTNEFGAQPVLIGAAHVAISAGGATIRPGTDRVLTFNGQPSITIQPGAPVLSDPVDLVVENLESLAVSTYLPQATGPATWHADGGQTAYVVLGNATGAAGFGAGTIKLLSRFFLSGVEAGGLDPRNAIVALGDSITDGFNSTVDANRRWPDRLAERLAASGSNAGVVDAGIGENRLLYDIVGPSALSRFNRDVVATPGVRFLTVLLGINDILLGSLYPNEAVTAQQIIGGYGQLIARAHGSGIRIYGATLTPFDGAGTADEAERQAVNAWIRTSGKFDAVIDFDSVVRDPSNPSRILPAFDSGDHLHPNDAGYKAMADSINLDLFEP